MGQTAQTTAFSDIQPSVQGPWSLPSGWEWVPLRKVVSIYDSSRKPIKKSARMPGSIPYCGANGVIDSVAGCTHEGDFVLLAEDGGSYGPGDLTAYRMKGKFWANNHVHILKGIDAILDNGWLMHSLVTLDLRLSLTGATRPKLTQKAMRQLLLPIPTDLDIQRQIVVRIEALMADLKKARILASTIRSDTDRFMEATLAEVFSKLPPNRCPLIEVIEKRPRNGWSPRCDNNPTGAPVLKLGAVLGFRFDPSAIKYTSLPTDPQAHYWVTEGDILISRSNTPDLVGHAAIYSGQPSPCIYPDLLMKMRTNPNVANPKFVTYWLRSQEARVYIRAHATGASSTMKKITQDDVCSLPFPKITIEEQQRVVAYLDAIQTEIDEMRRLQDRDTEHINQVERAILERAFRGKL